MQAVDYVVIVLYIFGIVGAGMVFASRMKSSKEMFSAGGQSPWWVSGLSGFMTMFSAGTFVVWGGIAYKYGVVAIFINLAYGVAAMLVGWFIAGQWRKLGVDSASEFLRLRFGASIVQFYTWFKGLVGLFTMGGAVYALSKIVCALIPLPAGHLLVDPATGHLSVAFASCALCVIVIIITFIGGLWAVLMTDVLQFVILTVSVVFVVPLIILKAGGFGSFLDKAPEGFLAPVAADFSWWFIIGWMIVNFCVIGAEWTFVQRYLCVPTVKDAKKSAYLFGVMYLVSPIIWMIPPMIFRVLNPNVDTEQAYILACQLVLPAGMMGLMVAAMASATASMATTRLNVFAGAFTTEVYHRKINQGASEKQLVFIGRLVTVILGCIVISGALLIPKYGYTSFIIDINTLLYGPMLMPTIWGLFSRKIGLKAVWGTVLIGFVAAYVIKFGLSLSRDGFLTETAMLRPLVEWIAANSRIVDLTSGLVVPFFILLFLEIFEKHEHPGWSRIMDTKKKFEELPPVKSSALPGKMVVICLTMLAVVMGALSIINREQFGVLITLTIVLLAIAGTMYGFIRRADRIAQ
tara:strand:+ start:3059 stop:4786 length:1728 start_codon:yes stop_codon:yes gene_type:complete